MSAVRIVEVGPRDGLQNIRSTVQTATKIELIRRLSGCGLATIEATSFVSPKWVPQLADGADVLSQIQDLLATSNRKQSYPVLVPNLRGLASAVKCGAREVAIFISASEGFSQRNTNCTIDQALQNAAGVAKAANTADIRVRGYVSSIFVCPFDGPTDPVKVLQLTQALLNMGCYEVSLGDTVGVGTPVQVRRLLATILPAVPATRLAGHFHDTYGQAVANVAAAYEMGLRVFDSSVAGLGGCPYAPGAKGNVATEDIVYLFQQMGVPTGVDLDRLAEVGQWITREIHIENSSRAGAALLAKRHASSALSHHSTNIWNHVKDAKAYLIERAEANIRITLSRPKNGNALTADMMSSLTTFLKDIANDRSVHCIVLSAQGKFFCTGMDLSPTGSTGTDSTKMKDDQFYGLKGLFEAIDDAPQTTVAEITGPCFGGGVGLAMACDIRLALETSNFTLSETKLGMVPAIISRYLVREWGISRTREAMLTARAVSPAELLQAGVIHGVASDLSSLHKLLHVKLAQIQRCAPMASKRCKELVTKGWKSPGGVDQDAAIREVYDEMMVPSAEARYGMAKFKAGIKTVDWTNIDEVATEPIRSKI